MQPISAQSATIPTPLLRLPLSGSGGRARVAQRLAPSRPSQLVRSNRAHAPLAARAAAGGPSLPTTATTAKEAVDIGLLQFAQGDHAAALQLFLLAQRLSPDEEEACAASYNAACALTKLRRWGEAADAVVAAVNDHGLKLSVALADPDLAPLRETREWTSALERAAGGITTDAFIKLRAESRAPFRLVRLILVGGLSAGAILGLIISTARLAAALGGAEGAPELGDTLRTCGINAAALAALLLLLRRDLGAVARDEEVAAREEALAQLQVALGPGRVVPLAAFRGAARPVILAGTRKQVGRAVAAAKPWLSELRERGVSIVPLVLAGDGDEEDEDVKAAFVEVRRRDKADRGAGAQDSAARLRELKAEFSASSLSGEGGGGAAGGGGGGGGGGGKGFGTPAAAGSGAAAAGAAPAATPPGEAVVKLDRRWELQPAAPGEWEAWLRSAVKAAGGLRGGVYAQVQLDGSVRASGTGVPPWKQWIDDIPEMDSVRTKFGDGAGMS